MILINTHITEFFDRPVKEFELTCLDNGDILLESDMEDARKMMDRLNRELLKIKEKEISRIAYLEKELQKAKAVVKNIDIALGYRKSDED